MKIAMIGQKGMPARYGGVERHVHDLSVGLVKAGHSVKVYSREWYSEKRPKKVEGVNIEYTPSVHTKHLDTITHVFGATLHAIFDSPDVIHYHGVGPALLSWIPRLFNPSIRVITTFHSIDRYQKKWGNIAKLFLRIGEWATCKFAHSVIVISKELEKYVKDKYTTSAVYIPNAVSNSSIEKYNGKETLSQWGIEPKKYILIVARLISLKGVHHLIQAYKNMQVTAPEILDGRKLVIVGDSCGTEQYVDDLKSMAKDNDSIIFTGFQSGNTLSELFSGASLFVHPSKSEGLPLSVLEAMSFGLPVLVSNIPGHTQLISESEFQFVSEDLLDLEIKLCNILLNKNDYLEAFGTKNKQLIIEKYSWNVLLPKVVEAYKRQEEIEKLEMTVPAV